MGNCLLFITTVLFTTNGQSLFIQERMLPFSLFPNRLTGLLCGIAVDEGYIKSVDDYVTDYIPELAQYNATFKKLRIVHLLNMQAGFDFYEDYELTLKGLFKIFKITQLQYGHDFTRLFRHIKFKSQPGEKI